MEKKFYSIQQTAEKAEIYIFGDIYEEAYWDGEVSPNSILAQIRDIKAPVIDVHIDSYGGEISAGWAIYNELLNHPAKIHTFADGFVASAAVYPFLAGDIRTANNVSVFFLHNAMAGAWGYSEDLRKMASELDKLTEIGVNAFIERAGMTKEQTLDLMAEESWLSPSEAFDLGIATEVQKSTDEKYSQSARALIVKNLIHPADHERAPEHDSKPVKNGLADFLFKSFDERN